MARKTDISYRQLKVEDLADQAFKFDDDNEGEDQRGPDENTINQYISTQRWLDILKELARTIPLQSKDQVCLFYYNITQICLLRVLYSRISRTVHVRLLQKHC